MARDDPRRVVVIGASLAGAFAAVAASGDGRSVVVLERDVLPAAPAPRPGVPQGRQPHVLLHRGLLSIEELLPGLRTELLAAGAVRVDTADLAWLGEFGWAPRRGPEYEVVSATRALLEHVVLGRVRALPGVRVREGAAVRSVHRDDRRGTWVAGLSDGSSEEADLLIDASGRSSRLPGWLAAAGLPPAAVSQVDARLGYATRAYRGDGTRTGTPGIVILQTPQSRAGGIALQVEDDHWLIGAVGSGDRRPPRDAEGFRAFLAALRDPAIADLERSLTPVSDVSVHRQTANRRVHYEWLRAWPDGLLVVGDALCAFNPVYGQGITVAAGQALLLRRWISRGLPRGGGRRLLRALAAAAALPWAIATGEDLRYASSAGEQGPVNAALGAWTRELGRLSVHGNLRAQATLSSVYHLVAHPVTVFHPGLLAAAAGARLRGYGPPARRPEELARVTAPVARASPAAPADPAR